MAFLRKEPDMTRKIRIVGSDISWPNICAGCLSAMHLSGNKLAILLYTSTTSRTLLETHYLICEKCRIYRDRLHNVHSWFCGIAWFLVIFSVIWAFPYIDSLPEGVWFHENIFYDAFPLFSCVTALVLGRLFVYPYVFYLMKKRLLEFRPSGVDFTSMNGNYITVQQHGFGINSFSFFSDEYAIEFAVLNSDCIPKKDRKGRDELINSSVDSSDQPDYLKRKAKSAIRIFGPILIAIAFYFWYQQSSIRYERDLRSADHRVRTSAAFELGKKGDIRAYEPLLAILGDGEEDDWVRKNTTRALGRLGDIRAIEPLLAVLDSSRSCELKKAAVEALGHIGHSRVIERLQFVINTPPVNECYLRDEAIKSLGQIGGTSAVDVLVRLLENGDWHYDLIEALGEIGDERAVSVLVSKLPSWREGRHIAETLNKIGWTPQTSKDRIHFLLASRKIEKLNKSWNETKQVLLSDVGSSNREAMRNAILGFIYIGNEEILEDLVTALFEHGSKPMVEAYLNCGHDELAEAAERWASRHGYVVIQDKGNSTVSWGGWR